MAVKLLLSGDKSNEIWNLVQNHQAESSLDLVTPVFSYIDRAVFSTVRSEMNNLFATSFFVAPQAISSAISDSRLVRIAS